MILEFGSCISKRFWQCGSGSSKHQMEAYNELWALKLKESQMNRQMPKKKIYSALCASQRNLQTQAVIHKTFIFLKCKQQKKKTYAHLHFRNYCWFLLSS